MKKPFSRSTLAILFASATLASSILLAQPLKKSRQS